MLSEEARSEVIQTNFTEIKHKPRDFLLVLLFMQLVVYVTVFLDIPVARQAVGFVYFTFVPGFIIIQLLKLDELDGFRSVLLSAGFSIAFLMLAGLFLNELGPMLHISRPLSLEPLLIVLNSLITFGAVLIFLRRRDVSLWNTEFIGLSPLALLFIGLPILSIIGATWINAYGNNLILLLMILAVSVLFGTTVVSKNLLPPKLYAFALLLTTISLLCHASLISNYLVNFGSDAQLEYFLLKTTENSARWNAALWSPTSLGLWSQAYGRTNAMLSITVLPTVYSILLRLDPTWVFKMLFPLIFSFVPLGLYQIWQTYVGRKYAFISAFLFVAESTFYMEMLGLNRQMIGEFFLVLLLLVTLDRKLKPVNKIICFAVFSFALVTSHYALAEILLFFFSFTLLSLVVLKRPSRNIAVSMVVFFFVVMFTWYIYTSGSAVFDSFITFGSNVYNQLGDFANPASRGQTVLMGLGLEEMPSIWNSFSRAFAYIVQGLTVFGFVGLLLKKTKMKFDLDYFMLNSAAMFLLAALILVPGLANTLNMTRFYHILLFFLAPLCAMGAEVIVKSVFKKEKELIGSLLLLVVLVPYFLFQTGFVYEITGTQSYSLPLSKHRMSAVFLRWHLGYFDECEVLGAFWMSENVDVENSTTYADRVSPGILIGYGMIHGDNLKLLSNVTALSIEDNIYLNRVTVVDGLVLGTNSWNTTSVSGIWALANKIYSNNGCEIYKEHK